MQFTINRNGFIAELNNVLRAVASKTTLEILTNLKLEATERQLVLTGSNSDITIQSTIAVDAGQAGLVIEEPGAILLPARFFADIIKKLPADTVTLAVKTGFLATITSGAAEFKINGQDAVNYPNLPEVEGDQSVQVAPDL